MRKIGISKLTVASAGLLIFLMAACSGGTSATNAASSSVQASTPATSSSGTTASAAASSTGSALPTYTEVVATYPASANTCDTEATLSRSGYKVTNGSIQFSNGQFQVICYGVKVTVKERTSIQGTTYAPGTKLTVDKNMKLTPVSSWD